MDFPTSDDPLVRALQRLVAREGSCQAVALKADAHDQTIYQIAFLKPDSKTGKLKSVGPSLRKRLTNTFPDWLHLADGSSTPAANETRAVYRLSPVARRDAETLLRDLRVLLERVPAPERHGMAGLWASFCNSGGADHHMNALLALLRPWNGLPDDTQTDRVAGA